MSTSGRLSITFNKDYVIDKRFYSLLHTHSQARLLQEEAVDDALEIDIEEVIYFKMADADDDDTRNKRISSIALDRITRTSLEALITFEEPSDISVDLAEPDVLYFYFNNANLFIDAETYERFSDERVYKIELAP